MKKFSEQLSARSKAVKLRVAEKRDLRERVISYMEYHPLPAEMKATKIYTAPKPTPKLAEPFTTFNIPFVTIFKSSAFTAILLLAVVPFVAERAVPGDTLYAIKVQFNEELRSTLTFDTYQKVEWETERLNRRIAEARLLASKGKLTEEAEADVAEAVRVHSANAQREIAELRTEDEDAATIALISLDTTLELQSTSLKGEDGVTLADEDLSPEGRSTGLITNAIDESRTLSVDSTASSTLPAYGKLMAKVEQNTTRIYELLATLEKVALGDELTNVTRRVEDINRAINEAIETNLVDEDKSREQLVAVLQSTQRLVVFMTELEVVKTVDIETLIPVVPTVEEEEAQYLALVEELDQKMAKIDILLDLVDDENIIAKVTFVQDKIAKDTEEVASSSENSKAFTVLIKEGIVLADDALKLLEQHQIILPVEVSTTTATSSEDIIDVDSTASTTIGVEIDRGTSTEEVVDELANSEEIIIQ